MKKMNSYLTVAKVNFKYSTWIAYLVSGICVLAMISDIIVDKALKNVDNVSVSMYCMLYLVCILAPVLIASANYGKLMNIGVKKKQYFFGCIINYVVFAAVISLLSVLQAYLLDPVLSEDGSTILGLISVFGWNSNVFTAFFSQFSFLLLLQSVLQTLTFMQTKWYGWVADGIIVAIISVFTPIPVLRSAEIFFFNLIIFSAPYIQIPVCLALAAAIYLSNLHFLKKRSA